MKRKSPGRLKSELWHRLRPEVDLPTLVKDIREILDKHGGKSARHAILANNLAAYLTQKYSVSSRKAGELCRLIEHHSDDLDTFLQNMSHKEYRWLVDNLDKLALTNKKPPRVRPQTEAEAAQRRKKSKDWYERRRRRYREGLIIKQFGRPPTVSLVDLSYVPEESPCLDILFKGGGIRMAGEWYSLENLFGQDRHRFPKPLRHEPSGRTKLYYLNAFTECLIFLVANRDGGKQWLPEGPQREHVLKGIIERAHRFSSKMGEKLGEKLRPFLP